jgi:hypothetical protein
MRSGIERSFPVRVLHQGVPLDVQADGAKTGNATGIRGLSLLKKSQKARERSD